jgi:hypothetical protein
LPLSDCDQRFSINSKLVPRFQDARVAVDLDGTPESSQLPPKRQVPWHQRNQAKGDRKDGRVMSVYVRVLVRHDGSLLLSGRIKQPNRKNNPRTEKADNSRADISR